MHIRVWQRWNNLAHELGVATACLYLLDRFIRKLDGTSGFYFYRFVAQPLAKQPRLSANRGKAFTFFLLDAPDPILDVLGRPSSVILERFARGAQCLVASKNGLLVGCIWFVYGAYTEDEVCVSYLLPKEGHCVWDFDVYVADSERLGFLFAKQWDAFDALLKPKNVRYTISRINAFNQRSMSSHRSLGAKSCGWALFICLGSFQWMISNQRPYFSVGGRPALKISPELDSGF